MTEQEYRELVREGQAVLQSRDQELLKALNLVSERFIHTKDTFRRRQDIDEICVALALYRRSSGR